MKSTLLKVLKVAAYAASYLLIFAAAVFLTMSLLIKGDEVLAPDFKGSTLPQARQEAKRSGVKLKCIAGNFDRHYAPETVIDQFPSPGVKVKEGSFVKVLVTSELVEVIVPDLTGHDLKSVDGMLEKTTLKRRLISYIDSPTAPVDLVISQSVPSGAKVPAGTPVDLLVSKGAADIAFVMPDLIGGDAARVVAFFETHGLRISNITEVPYPGLRPGVVIKQFPAPGYRISRRNLIGIQVSQ
ncbi:MAG: PASTA domain-containing protein [Acidobacteriota bacterium]|jgi:serine/threonine-protein kinase|nr:PASTA domain-containing protein [Acidobacteriota bacterium]